MKNFSFLSNGAKAEVTGGKGRNPAAMLRTAVGFVLSVFARKPEEPARKPAPLHLYQCVV
ncbi:MAG: hypothetical protein GC131_02585 [Alphaproteobacteria bacterium]|nr:hypothetical protein [Alphaproteobacteria bacterium]